jgi:hypothetical protein
LQRPNLIGRPVRLCLDDLMFRFADSGGWAC